MAARIYSIKFCRSCDEGRGRWLPVSAFGRNKTKPDGLASNCKKCRVTQSLAWAEQNKRSVKQYQDRYYQNNREKELDRTRRWQELNREKYIAQAKSRRDRRRLRERAAGNMPASHYKILFRIYSKCCCCGSTNNLTHDHIVPLSKGGDHTIHNSQVLCFSCNASKRDRHSTDYRYIGIDTEVQVC